jgi:hypothetical protein
MIIRSFSAMLLSGGYSMERSTVSLHGTQREFDAITAVAQLQ